LQPTDFQQLQILKMLGAQQQRTRRKAKLPDPNICAQSQGYSVALLSGQQRHAVRSAAQTDEAGGNRNEPDNRPQQNGKGELNHT
jgi:hypothetical protein